MTITHKIKMDLASKGIAPKINMVQGDCCSRKIELQLYSGRVPWHAPKDALVLTRYRRPDHSVGTYDTLPDGSSAYAIAGNTVTVSVAPEALAIPGTVFLVVTLATTEQELSTFELQLDVQPNYSSGPVLDGNYASITDMIQIPDSAEVGQTVVVKTVSDSGRPTQWETVDLPQMPEDYLPLDGSEPMTGELGTPRIRINGNADSNLWPRVRMHYDGAEIGYVDIDPNNRQLRLVQRSTDGHNEVYRLPLPLTEQTGAKIYQLLTSRNPVTVAQGGTGAATAAKARENLGAASADHIHDGRYYTEEEIDTMLPKAFYITITDNGDGSGIADKGCEETAAAYQAGKSVCCLLPVSDIGNLVMPLLNVDPASGTYLFGAKDIISGTTKVAMYTASDSVQLLDFPSGISIVTVTDNGDGTCSIDKTATDLIAAALVGTMYAKMTIGGISYLFPLVLEDDNFYIFEGETDGSDNNRIRYKIAINKTTASGLWIYETITTPNPNALTINGIKYDGSSAVTMTISVRNEAPDYVVTEAARVAKLVQRRQNANTLSFLAGSDIHARLNLTLGGYTTARMLASAKHAAQAMQIIRQQVHMDFGAILGDTLWDSGETTDQAMEIFRTVREYFQPAFVGAPQFWLKGNHDYLGEDTKLTDEQVFSGIGIHNSGAVFDSANKVAGYCYQDFAEYQLRVVCLSLPEDGLEYGISTAQINWLADALDVSGKGDDWKILILSHMPVDDFAWVTDFMTAITDHKDRIIANIHGHMHNYQTGTVTGTTIPRIGIPAICPYRTKDLEGNEVNTAPHQKTADSAEDTAFCVITIDLANKMIYADHYGAGEDRVIDYTAGAVATSYIVTHNLTNVSSSNALDSVESGSAYNTALTATSGSLTSVKVTMGGTDITDTAYSDGSISIAEVTGNIVITAVAGDAAAGYTNQIPLSTEADGVTIYNGGIGYKTDARLNSSAEEVAVTGMCCTGYIPATGGDIIRIKNVTLAGASSAYLHYFAAVDKNHMGNFTVEELTAATADDITTVTIPVDDHTYGFIRLSCGVIDDTSIITVNQQIL